MNKLHALVFITVGLAACSEPAKHQIAFSDDSTCRIIINDLQYGMANETERPCALEYGTAGEVKTATVNFLSEKCNAYRYTLKRKAENGTAILAFQASENVPNTGCEFIPEYSDGQAEWHLGTPGAQQDRNRH
jgi:hypothetical protein